MVINMFHGCISTYRALTPPRATVLLTRWNMPR